MSGPDISDNQPLVSIVAISYNQAEWVIEALNSIFQQDYKNIELIISDDASTDGTKNIIQSWINQYEHRFKNIALLTSKENQGICLNIAKGIKASKGIWIKPMACDDFLRKDAISKFVTQVKEDGAEVAFSQAMKFHLDDFGNRYCESLVGDDDIAIIKEPADRIYYALRLRNFLPAPSAFYSRKIFNLAGGIDIRFKHLDDWPLWLRMITIINKVSWVNSELVFYRVSEKSITSTQKVPISYFLYEDIQLFTNVIQYPALTLLERFDRGLFMLRQRLVVKYFGNSRLAYLVLTTMQLASPILLKKVGAIATRHLSRLNWK